MVEGIMNLLEKLSLENPDSVELNVIAATRRDLEIDDNQTTIELKEYSERIKEKLYMKLAEKDLFLSKNCKVNFELSSARKNPKLQISDVVCNSKLTLGSKKFSEEQKELLDKIFSSSKYVFNVFRTDFQKKISDYLIQNNIVDAIFMINEVDEPRLKRELINLLINNINNMPSINLRLQFELLSLKIRTVIDVQRNLVLCEKFLVNIQENIINKIEKEDFIINKLKLDVSLYLLTIYTHLGNNIKSKQQLIISKKELEKISGSWDFLEYYYIYKNREAIYYNTCFNNKETINVLTEAIKKLEHVLDTMKEIDEFGNVKSSNLAKAAGTRLQAYTNLITPNTTNELRDEYYKKAVLDSEFAIEQFVSEMDKRRQYQYRCMLELAYGNLEQSLIYLMKVVGLNETNFDKFIEEVDKIQDFSRNFVIANYFEVMQYVSNNKMFELASKMYQAFYNNKNIYNKFKLEESVEIELDDNLFVFENKSNEIVAMHPFEMIYWSLGKYHKESDKKIAIKYFDKAIELCNEMNESTIRVIELAIEADKLSISDNINEDKNVLIQKYNNIMNNKDMEDVHEFLNKLRDDFECIELFDKRE